MTDQTPTPPALDLATLRGWIEVGIPCASEHALEVIARAEAAEAKIAAVRERAAKYSAVALPSQIDMTREHVAQAFLRALDGTA